MTKDVKVTIDERSEAEAFPQVDPGIKVLGDRILLQLRSPKVKTKSGLVLVEETRDTIKYNEVVCKVVQLGPLCYRDKVTLEPYPEGKWIEEGQLCRAIKWGGDRFTVPAPDGESMVHFIIVNEAEIIAKIESYEAASRMLTFVEQ